MKNTIISAVVASAALFCTLPIATAQEAAPAAPAAASTNSVEITDAALRKLVAVLTSPDLTAGMALAAFNEASEQMEQAILLAKMDLAQARRDLEAYDKSGKADDIDDLMEKASNKKLQELLQKDEQVAQAFVRYISALGMFDRLLNSGR